ncbi:MAG: hypothetical protein PVI59_17395 [Anaerolineae bacterium]|jgi:hypothetical protein
MGWLDVLFPSLLICGLFGVILLVGIGFSYLGLVWLHKEMTKCPECSRRGAGELVEREVVASEVNTEWKDRRGIFGRDRDRRQLVQVTEETYEEHFECQYCGHCWTRTTQETQRDSR